MYWYRYRYTTYMHLHCRSDAPVRSVVVVGVDGRIAESILRSCKRLFVGRTQVDIVGAVVSDLLLSSPLRASVGEPDLLKSQVTVTVSSGCCSI